MTYDAQKCLSCKKPFQHCLCMVYCRECGGVTNHTTEQHREAEANGPQEP